MLTVLYGTDTQRRRARQEALVAPLVKKGAQHLSFSDTSFDPDALRTIAEQSSLFGEMTVVTVSGIGDNAELRESFLGIAKGLAESSQIFILSENALLAPFVKSVTGAGGTVEKFEGVKKKAETFNTFALTDAYAARNRSQAWSLYRGAISAGIAPREIHGLLFWCIKNMIIAEYSPNAESAGMHAFVYGKAKSAAKGFQKGELQKLLVEVCALVHEATYGGLDLETAMEAFILRSLAPRVPAGK